MKNLRDTGKPPHQDWAGIIRPSSTPFANWSTKAPDGALSQFEVLVNSLPTQRHKDEFRFLFVSLPEKDQRAILELHTRFPDVKAKAAEHKGELMALINDRLEGKPIPLNILARVERLENAIRVETKFADADHIYVYCLATIRSRFTDVCVMDDNPTTRFDDEVVPINPKTAYLTESFIADVSKKVQDR